MTAGKRCLWLGQGLVLLAAGLAGGCALFRSEPAPVPPPEAAVEVKPATEPAPEIPEPIPRAMVGFAAARCALMSGMGSEVDPLLDELGRAAREESNRSLLAWTLFVRGSLAWREGDGAAAGQLLEATLQSDPHGPFSEPASLSLGLINRLQRAEDELSVLVDKLGLTERVHQRARQATETLQTEVDLLRKQLDELKQVHLQVESEKKDGSS